MAIPFERSKRLNSEALTYLQIGDAKPAPPLETLSVAEARQSRNEAMIANSGLGEVLERVEGLSAPGPQGEIPLRLYADAGEGLRPCVVYFHGGGFVLGDLNTHDAFARALAKASGAVLISVDYALAPERRYPAAVEDAYAATLWVAEHAEQLGVDASRISVAGDSAGGNLATVVALRCRDRRGPKLVAQVLMYPVTDLSSLTTVSYLEFAQGYGLTRAAMAWFRDQYLASTEQGNDMEASPLLAKDLSGLPPTLVVTAEFDPLRDEGEVYAARLKAAGVAVTLTRYPGMIHGFCMMFAVLSDSLAAMGEMGAFLRSVNA